MAALHIRNVPDPVVEALKARARRNERSLQGEVRVILEAAAGETQQQPVEPIRLHWSSATPETTWSRQDVYDDDGR